MSEKIFGYEWEDIQRAQQGGKLNKPVQHSIPVWTESDQKDLEQYPTAEALEDAGLYGVLDRAKRLGKV